MHKHPDYNGFVSTVLPRRVTFGGELDRRSVYLNNHQVGILTTQLRADGVVYTLQCSDKYMYSAYNLLELIPFIGYTPNNTEF